MPPFDSNQALHSDSRLAAADRWIRKSFSSKVGAYQPVAGDASFRRYFRVPIAGTSRILMDAPPRQGDSTAFMRIDGLLREAGLHAPEIISVEPDQGFMLLEDLGQELYRDLITEHTADAIFSEAFSALTCMATRVEAGQLPAYDRNRLIEELELFTTWWLGRHRSVALSCAQDDVWQSMCTHLLLGADAQPQVFVHRDFHSCNLLKTTLNSPGIIDFQDAVRGPLSYDLVSLLWDRYISWPRDRIEGWVEAYRQQLGLKINPADWLRYCDWMSLQRNLKVVGIFARLHYRDGKQGYLEMVPRFWSYVLDTCERYPEFHAFRNLLGDLECAP